jgi:hypothetical protein
MCLYMKISCPNCRTPGRLGRAQVGADLPQRRYDPVIRPCPLFRFLGPSVQNVTVPAICPDASYQIVTFIGDEPCNGQPFCSCWSAQPDPIEALNYTYYVSWLEFRNPGFREVDWSGRSPNPILVSPALGGVHPAVHLAMSPANLSNRLAQHMRRARAEKVSGAEPESPRGTLPAGGFDEVLNRVRRGLAIPLEAADAFRRPSSAIYELEGRDYDEDDYGGQLPRARPQKARATGHLASLSLAHNEEDAARGELMDSDGAQGDPNSSPTSSLSPSTLGHDMPSSVMNAEEMDIDAIARDFAYEEITRDPLEGTAFEGMDWSES